MSSHGSRKPTEKYDDIRVAIKRPDIVATGPQRSEIRRSLEDVSQLSIHRDGEGRKPIFERDDILCNHVDYNEDASVAQSESTRLVYNSPNRRQSNKRSPSSSKLRRDSRERSNHSRSRSRSSEYRKHNDYRRRSREYSPPLRPGEYRPKKNERRRSKSREYSTKYNSRDKEQRRSRSRDYSPPLKPGEYRPRKNDRGRSREYSPLRPGEFRPRRRSHSRDYSPPLRPGEYRPKKHLRKSRSPNPEKSRYDSARRSRSLSPKPSTSKRYSRSPTEKHKRDDGRHDSSSRRSRSVDRHKKMSRHSQERRSRSPREEDKNKYGRHSRSPSSSYRKRSPGYRRSSRSPSEHSTYKKSYDRRRSKSPHRPIVTFDRSSSRTYKRSRRSRSRSPHNELPQYPPYFEAPEFWIPGPPGFRPALVPITAFPRGVPGPVLIPYPRMPNMGYRPFRPRYPVYNSAKTFIKKSGESTSVPSITSADEQPEHSSNVTSNQGIANTGQLIEDQSNVDEKDSKATEK